MNSKRLMTAMTSVLLLMLLSGCGGGGGAGDTDDHGDHGDHADHGDHGGHDDHGDEDGHSDHGESESEGHDVVNLTEAQLFSSGVVIEPLGGGEISTYLMLPAEIGLNLDNVLHVTPRVSGIVSQVHGYLGGEVQEGELLALIESPELGEAKILYLQMIQVQSTADVALERQKIISMNTEKLLDILRDEPDPSELRVLADDLRIGADKGRLLSAYARMKAGSANYDREMQLNAKGLSTQADLLATQEMYYSAQAEYMAAYEDVEFSYRLALQESYQEAAIASMSVDNAERRLHLLGMTQEDVDRVVTEPDVNIAKYELLAPVKGQIIEKHLTPGEKLGTDGSVYTIADMSTVWMNIAVYSQYFSDIKEGQLVTVSVGDRRASGVVDYISAVISESSRTVNARVVIQNPDRDWKPGEFVTVLVETEKVRVDRMVPAGAIQSYEGHSVVFVRDEDGIEPVRVRIGRKNDFSVELLGSDLAIGTPVVVSNSFLIKAELGKGAAGHDH